MSRFSGVAVGLVKNLDDPRSEGRISVSFPWLPQSLESAWAPVATPLAGKQRGLFFMPEVGDEVLVAFEHGDFNHPFIVGFLWNGVDQPPATANTSRIIVTPGGHQLRFEDGDPKKVTLISSQQHVVTLDGSGISLKTKSGVEATLDDGANAVKLQGGGRVLKLADGKVQIS